MWNTTSGVAMTPLSRDILGKVKFWEQNQIVYRTGDPVQAVYWVHSGTVKICKLLPDNRLQTVRTISEGEWLGIEETDLGHFAHTAITQEKSQLSAISMDTFSQTLAKNPAFRVEILNALCQRIYQVHHRLYRQDPPPTNQNLARLLLEMEKDTRGDAPGPWIDLEFRLSAMATYLRSDEKRVFEEISQLYRRGLVELAGKMVRIVNRRQLQAMLQQQPVFQSLDPLRKNLYS